MSAVGLRPELMRVPVALLNEPDIAMRQSFDPLQLEELVESIRAHGILQNLVLIRAGERYTVAAGHRRSIAAVLAGLDEVPALVFPEGTPAEEAMKVAENSARERVNPADEALYFNRLLTERCGNDTERLAGMVGLKLSFVEGRLDLLRGYPEVLEALQQRKINLAVAQELNRYKDAGFMKSHLSTAIETGARAKEVIRWRTDVERLHANYPQPDTAPGAAPAPAMAAPPSMACLVCGESHDPYNLEMAYIHRGGPCKGLLRRALGPLAGEEA